MGSGTDVDEDAGGGADGDLTRTERRFRRVHESLLDAVDELVIETGTAVLNVTEVADRADVAQGTFYNHFADIDEALSASLDRDLATYLSMCGRLIDDDMDAVERWVVLTAVVIHRVVRDDWGPYASVIYQHPRWPRSGQPSPSRAVIDEGVAEGTMTVSDADLAYRLNHHLHLGLADRTHDDGDVDLTQTLHDLLDSGAALLGIDRERVPGLVEWITPRLGELA